MQEWSTLRSVLEKGLSSLDSIDGSPHSVTRRSKFAMRRTDLYTRGLLRGIMIHTGSILVSVCTLYEINQPGLNLVTISYRINIRR